MNEFWMVACKKPVPTAEARKFSGDRLLGRAYRIRDKKEPRSSNLYSYLGTAEIPDDELSPYFWLETADGAVAFKTLDDAETAAFAVCVKHPHLLGCLEILSYGG